MNKFLIFFLTFVSISIFSTSSFAQIEIKNPKYFRTDSEGFPGGVVGKFRISCESNKDIVCNYLGFNHAIDYSCKNKEFGTIGGRVSTAIDCGLNFLVGGPSGMCGSQGGSNGWMAILDKSNIARMDSVESASVIKKITCL